MAKNHFRVRGKGADLLNDPFKEAKTCAIGKHGRARDKIKGSGHFVEVIYDVSKNTSCGDRVLPSIRHLISPTKPPRSIIKFGTGGRGVKVKLALEQAKKAQRGSRGIAPHFL